MNNDKIINMANHNIKKAHDDVTQRLLDAKNGKDNNSSVFEKDGIIWMHHQNTLISFTPEQAVTLSEGLMTAGWTLIEDAKQQENEDGKQSNDTTGSSKEPGESTEDEGSSEGQEQKED